MLDHLRRRVSTVFSTSDIATLATHGPAGLLANMFPCAARGLYLYLQVPRTSDHLVNLETDSSVVVATVDWQARGRARLLSPTERPDDLPLLTMPEAQWYLTVEVRPERVEITHATGWGSAETIDLDI